MRHGERAHLTVSGAIARAAQRSDSRISLEMTLVLWEVYSIAFFRAGEGSISALSFFTRKGEAERDIDAEYVTMQRRFSFPWLSFFCADA